MKAFTLFFLAQLLVVSARAQFVLHIHVPSDTPEKTTVTVAGSFNGWNPAAPGYAMKPAGRYEYEMTLPDSIAGRIAFKFTLGTWERVETGASGADVANRTVTVPSAPSVYYGTIDGWRTAAAPAPRQSTKSRSVRILDTAFAMPQLGRTRRIWLYLPPDYDTGRKRYPVIYMHDGQNLFDAASSFAGEWGIDETLDSLQEKGDEGCIVIGIDNGSARTAEYSPWKNAPYGGGEGDAYLDFIVRTLKPYVDRHYRTRPDRLNTAIAGSSLGGNISLYAALKFPDVVSRAGIFSPAVWFNPEIHRFLATSGPPLRSTKLFFIMGTEEGSTPEDHRENLEGFRRLIDTLKAAGFLPGTSVDTLVRAGGQHTEWFWRKEFAEFYGRLFGPVAGEDPGPHVEASGVPYDAYTNANDSLLFVCSLGRERIPDGSIMVVFDAEQRQVGALMMTDGEGQLDVSRWGPGTYSVQFMGRERRWCK